MNRDRLVQRFRVSLRGTYCVKDKVVLWTLSLLAEDGAFYFLLLGTADGGSGCGVWFERWVTSW